MKNNFLEKGIFIKGIRKEDIAFVNEQIRKYESSIIESVLNCDEKEARSNYYRFLGCVDFFVRRYFIDINSEEFIYIAKRFRALARIKLEDFKDEKK